MKNKKDRNLLLLLLLGSVAYYFYFKRKVKKTVVKSTAIKNGLQPKLPTSLKEKPLIAEIIPAPVKPIVDESGIGKPTQINLSIVNNTGLTQNVNIMGSVTPQGFANNSNDLYEYDLSTQVLSNLTSVNIQISTTENPTLVTYSANIQSNSISAIVSALNTLNKGIFSYSGTTIYAPASTYVYGNLTVDDGGIIVASFASTWDTSLISGGSSTSTQIQLPLLPTGTYNFTVDWGDGNTDTITTWNQAETLHTYASSGTYVVTIQGFIEGWSFGLAVVSDATKILSVSSWDGLVLGDGGSNFINCSNLDLSSTTGILDLSASTDLTSMFNGCSSLTTINGIDSWDFSTVTMMGGMFSSCILFNQDLNSIDVSNVQSMNFMFSGATAFNGNIISWNTSSLTNASSMFSGATSFNQNIGSWNVSNVTSMNTMFQNATAFNQNIGSWDVSSVTDLFNFMAGKTNTDYSASYLNSIYNGWSTLTLQPTLTADFGTINYTSAGSAGRAVLTGTPNNWTVNDGGIVSGSSILGTTGNAPQGIASDSLGNIYTANFGASTVSKITPLGVSTIYANGLNTPIYLVFDSYDNLFVTNKSSNTVTKTTPSGVTTTFATVGSNPQKIIKDTLDNLYVGNQTTNSISKITPSGVVSTYGGFVNSPNSMVFDSLGNLFVLSGNISVIYKITPLGVTTTFITLPNFSTDIAIDSSNNIYVVYGTNVISKISPLASISTFTSGASSPLDITINSLNKIYVSNGNLDTISAVSSLGVVTNIGTTDVNPQNIIYNNGYIYTSNTPANNVSKIIT